MLLKIEHCPLRFELFVELFVEREILLKGTGNVPAFGGLMRRRNRNGFAHCREVEAFLIQILNAPSVIFSFDFESFF